MEEIRKSEPAELAELELEQVASGKEGTWAKVGGIGRAVWPIIFPVRRVLLLALAFVLALVGPASAQCPGGVCRPAPVVIWQYQPVVQVAVWNDRYPTTVWITPAPTLVNPHPRPTVYYTPAMDSRAALVPAWPPYQQCPGGVCPQPR